MNLHEGPFPPKTHARSLDIDITFFLKHIRVSVLQSRKVRKHGESLARGFLTGAATRSDDHVIIHPETLF